MENKILKPYRGFTVEKSWDVLCDVKINIVYTAYKENGSIFDSDNTLSGLRKRIDDFYKG